MKLWMNVMRDLESVMADPAPLFDAWAEGGVEGLVLGPMIFGTDRLLPGTRYVPGAEPPTPTFDPDPEIYRRLEVEPPPPARPEPEKPERLDRALSEAKARGFTVFLMYTESGAGPGGSGHYLIDD